LSKLDHVHVTRKIGCEAGLFLFGHGSKSVFWYWEIDSVGRTYRHFESADLERGMEAFQAENWALWSDVKFNNDKGEDQDEE
jgi:hypothetical protein